MLWATWARPALRQIKDCGVAQRPHVVSPPRRLSPASSLPRVASRHFVMPLSTVTLNLFVLCTPPAPGS